MEQTQPSVFIQGANSTSAKALILQLRSQAKLGLMCRKPSELFSALEISSQTELGTLIMHPMFPHGVAFFEGDALQEEHVDAAMATYVELSETALTGYVHFPGSVLLKAAHQTKLSEWQQVMDTNLTSAFIGLKAALVPMRRQGNGSIVLLSSVAASRGLPNHEAISAAKAGVEALVRSASATYTNIRINAVAPGLINAKATQKIVENERALAASVSLCAIKRAGEGKEIADAVAFLLSDKSSYMTAQVLAVDGGMSSLGFPKAP